MLEKPEVEAVFNSAWELYPRKEAKKDALKAWKAAVKLPLFMASEILEAIRQQTDNNWRFKDRQFIPLFATWLRGERWNDPVVFTTMDSKDRVTPMPRPEFTQEETEEMEREIAYLQEKANAVSQVQGDPNGGRRYQIPFQEGSEAI